MNAYILYAKRTPIGAFMGGLSSLPAPRLGAHLITAWEQANHNLAHKVGECIMGQVLCAGSGQAPARQTVLYAGLHVSIPCMTINKVCGSGLKAVMLACDSIALGRNEVVLAGGQENMSLAPYLLARTRTGSRVGHLQALDSMIQDGLWDPYNNFHMGNAAEICARHYNITREEQDAFAVGSYQKAQKAQDKNLFDHEITKVSIDKPPAIVSKDEEPGRALFEKIPRLKPAFEKAGTITPANASKINDGAAVCVLAAESYIKQTTVKPLVRVIAEGVFAQKPEDFSTAPVQAIKHCLQNAQLKLSDIDLFEINEAFSVVALAVCKQLGIAQEKLNVHGGAVALGHPIGASGARILVTLVHALHAHKKRYGMAAICLGGGEAVAMLVERS